MYKENEVEVAETISELETVAEVVKESPKKPTKARKPRKQSTTPTSNKKGLTVVNTTVLKLQIEGTPFPPGQPVEITGKQMENERFQKKVTNCLAKGIFKEV